MNTYTPYSTVSESFTFPSTPDSGTVGAVVYYDLEVISEPTPTHGTGSTYSVSVADDLIDSAGVYRIKWSCEIGGSPFYAYTEFQVDAQYLAASDFFNAYSDFDLPEYTQKYTQIEKLARRIIDTYTGQNFQSIKNKTNVYYGNGKQQIYLGARLTGYSEVLINETDYTENVEIDLRSKYYLRLLQQYPYPDSRRDDVFPIIFPKKTKVSVTGDWGWNSVPNEVSQAAELLIIDLLEDTRREHHRYGILRLEQGNNRLYFDKGIFNTTGNIDVDVILMDYVYWNMDYVS